MVLQLEEVDPNRVPTMAWGTMALSAPSGHCQFEGRPDPGPSAQTGHARADGGRAGPGVRAWGCLAPGPPAGPGCGPLASGPSHLSLTSGVRRGEVSEGLEFLGDCRLPRGPLQMVVLMDPMEDPDDILRAHRSREKSYLFDVAFDFTATQVMEGLGLGTPRPGDNLCPPQKGALRGPAPDPHQPSLHHLPSGFHLLCLHAHKCACACMEDPQPPPWTHQVDMQTPPYTSPARHTLQVAPVEEGA